MKLKLKWYNLWSFACTPSVKWPILRWHSFSDQTGSIFLASWLQQLLWVCFECFNAIYCLKGSITWTSLCTIKIWVYRHQIQGRSLYNCASFNDPSYKLLVSRSMKNLVHKPAAKHRVSLTVTKIPKFCYGPQYDGLKNKQVWWEGMYPSFLHARAWAHTNTHTLMRTHIYTHTTSWT